MKGLRELLSGAYSFWGRSIRRQMVWSFSLAALATVAGAGILLLSAQREFLYEQGQRSAFELARTLAFGSASWVLANDLAGLQEVLKGAAETTDLSFAVVISPRGEVLASTRPEYIGRYFTDPVSLSLLGRSAEPQVLLNRDDLIDVAVPIKANNAPIGWLRVELSRVGKIRELRSLAFAGLGIAGLLLLSIVVIATALSRGLTRGLNHLMTVAIDAEHGRTFRREALTRRDEVGVLARHLYRMLDVIESEKAAKFASEARFRRLVQVMPIPLGSADKDGVIREFNDCFAELFGYSRADIPTLDDWFQKAYPDPDYRIWAIATWDAAVQEAIESGESIRPREYRVTCKNGDVRVMDIAGVVLGDDVLAIFIDMTERMRNAEQLRRYKDHLEDEVQQRTADLVLARNAAETANKAKSTFLANMSHELRTPLNAIMGFSNVMRGDPQLRDDQRMNLDIINRSGEHLLNLINDVLEMAKIEAGRFQLENVAFDLGGLIRDITEMLDIRAKEKGLRLLVDQSSRFPRYVVGDQAHLRQVLINLVGNAVKFTEQGGVILRLGVRENSTSHLLIEIEDTGPGIEPRDQQRVFEPFEQLGEQGANKGTGLGLTITRQFVRLMGGKLELRSSPGVGSIFVVDLPLIEADEADVLSSPRREPANVVGLAPGQPNYRILIVEDQIENQLLLSKLMESVGLPVRVAENGERGVALFREWRPDLIWMDRRMPVMDGQEATRIIRGLPGGELVKIVAVTASVFVEQREELLRSGMDDFVRKPYRFSEIYDCLSRQLGIRFIYEGSFRPEQQTAVLTPGSLLVLPASLREELAQALESLEAERIADVIGRITASDPGLGKTLTQFAEDFDYPAILKALQALN